MGSKRRDYSASVSGKLFSETSKKEAYEVNVFHQILLWVDGCNELKDDDTKTVDVTLHCELVCGNVFWVHVAICTFKARIPAIEDLLL